MKNNEMPLLRCIKKYIVIDRTIYYDIIRIIMNIYDVIRSDNVLKLSQIIRHNWFELQHWHNEDNHNIAELALILQSYNALTCILKNYIYMRINSTVVSPMCPLNILKLIFYRMSNLDLYYLKAEKYAPLDTIIFMYFHNGTYTPHELIYVLKKINRFNGSIYDIK
jgi:hypothetical protein